MASQWYDLSLHVERRTVRPLETGEENLCGYLGCHLKFGSPIHDWNPNAWLRSQSVEDDGNPDDILLEHLGVPTFSRRLRHALERAGVGQEDIQYLPVHVFKSTGEELEGYAFANVIARVDALDYQRTDWGPLPPDPNEGIDPDTGKPQVHAIWRAGLIEARLEGHDVIRLVEFFPPVYVSERFADVYRDGNFTGATLTRVIMT